MEYLGSFAGLDFTQAGDVIFVFAAGRWCRYAHALEWFSTSAGQALRKVLWLGHPITLQRSAMWVS